MSFIEDMGRMPEKGYTIERIDNDGDYEPGNCRWASTFEQHSNRRDNVFITALGKTMTMRQWSRETGIWKTTIRARLQRGWSDEDAVTIPAVNGSNQYRRQV